MVSVPEPAGVTVEQARQLIVKAFADRGDVVAIALHIGATLWRVKVFTSHGVMYNYDAMDGLFEREYALLQELAELYVDIDYVSQGSIPLEELIPADSFVIFRR